MAKYLKLQVSSPCQENWNQMTPEAKGRFCLSCQKTVVDFTVMSDNELIQYFKTLQQPTCGRFSEDQLNRNMQLPRKPLPWINYFFKISLPAFLLSLKASAQGSKVPAPIIATAAATSKPSLADTTAKKLTVSSVVCDENNIPIVGASVWIKETKSGVVTDSKGQFTMSNVDPLATLVISSVGYHQKEINAASVKPGTELKLNLEAALMGELIVTYSKPRRKIFKEVKKEEKKDVKQTAAAPFQVYPNPVISGSRLNIQCHSLDKGTYTAAFYNLSGQLIQSSTVEYAKADNQLSVPVNQLSSGDYILQLTHKKTGKHFSQQIIVRN